MHQVDTHRQIDRQPNGVRHNCVRGDALRLDVRPGAERDVPHILDDQAVDAALGQRVSVAQCVVDDRLHAVAGVAGGAGQRPAVNHADDWLGCAEDFFQVFDLK
jgi:hypothetical protein